jgi:uncharacterized membrane protein YozB (DUF420 family)
MLLPLLILTVILASSISLIGLITVQNGKVRQSHQHFTVARRSFSLWSLVLFLFFPSATRLRQRDRPFAGI